MSQKIKEMDQNAWQCYKFEDGSYYYGEVGYLDEAGLVHPPENTQMASNPKAKLVKHGFGVYIYQPEQIENCRYEGHWEKDQKNGDGVLRMKNDSIYEGKFKEGYYHGNGKLVWQNGDVYEGSWKRSRMDGPGFFKRNDGCTLKGSFKNNYYIDGDFLRNPTMPDKQYEQMKKRRKEIWKQYEKNQKAKLGYLERVPCKNTDDILCLVKKSAENNRVPLILTSEQANYTLPTFLEDLKGKNIQVLEVDLRKGYSLEGEARHSFKKEVTNSVQEALRQGKTLMINLDESSVEFEEMFYPDIKEFYQSNGLNHTIWGQKDLKKEEIRNKIIENEEVHEDFRLVVWSKEKFPQSINSDFLYEKIKKRFEYVIPFIKIDIIYGQKVEEKVEEEAQ